MSETGKGKAKGLALGEPEPVAEVALTPELVQSMLKKIAQLEAEKNALIDERDRKIEPKSEKQKRAANESRPSSKIRYRIIIEEGREKNAPTHVFIGVNGRGYNIKRGQAVDVPPEVIENLKDAVEVTQVAIVDEERGVVTGSQERRVRRFPFTVLGKSRDEKGNKTMEDDVLSLDGQTIR
jgi:hypothetical protein